MSREPVRPIPILLGIDVEPDNREIHPTARVEWDGFLNLAEFLLARRKELERATGARVRFTWCLRLDPQIEHTYGDPGWAAKRYRPLFDRFLAEGDQLAVHNHAWKWDPAVDRWCVNHAEEAWVTHCVDTSHRVFRDEFGFPPLIFRHGDRFLSQAVIQRVDALGYRYELTLEPGQPAAGGVEPGNHVRGGLPSFVGVPAVPYRPAFGDYRRAGWLRRRNLWMIPVSTTLESGNGCHALVLGNPLSLVERIVESRLATLKRPFLSAAIRTDVRLHPVYGPDFDAALDYLCTHPLRERFRFTTAEELVRCVA